MYKEVLRGIENIELWPVISLIIFFSFFVGLLWWVFSTDKNHIGYMENIPLTADDQIDDQQTESGK
ncbi:MAG: cbb3-type cytochrome c oxidase subunit 3 [Cyclobacteriaceae bacterium]